MSELIAFGGYRTLDLRRFSFERVARRQLMVEKNVV